MKIQNEIYKYLKKIQFEKQLIRVLCIYIFMYTVLCIIFYISTSLGYIFEIIVEKTRM